MDDLAQIFLIRVRDLVICRLHGKEHIGAGIPIGTGKTFNELIRVDGFSAKPAQHKTVLLFPVH